MKNEYEDIISTLSSETRRVGLELVEKLEKLAETTRIGKPILLEVADYRSDGYNENSLVDKLDEWGILTVEGNDEYNHPIVLTSLDKLRKFKDALKEHSVEKILKRQEAEQALRPNNFTPRSTLPIKTSAD